MICGTSIRTRGAKMLNDLENWFDEVESERRTIPDDERIGV